MDIKAFFADTSGQAALLVLIVGVFDFLFGIAAAFRDKTFTWSAIDAWLRSNLMGKIAPVWLFLALGYITAPFTQLPMLNVPIVTPIALGGAAIYVTATIAAIASKWGPQNAKQGVPTD